MPILIFSNIVPVSRLTLEKLLRQFPFFNIRNLQWEIKGYWKFVLFCHLVIQRRTRFSHFFKERPRLYNRVCQNKNRLNIIRTFLLSGQIKKTSIILICKFYSLFSLHSYCFHDVIDSDFKNFKLTW